MLTPCFLRIHFNTIIPLHLDLLNYLFPSGLPMKNLYAFLISPVCSTCPAHHTFWFCHSNHIWLRSTNYWASRYADSFSLHLHPSWVQIFYSAPSFTPTQNSR
jgi:hypothetical protein